jgi:hypothetical protein
MRRPEIVKASAYFQLTPTTMKFVTGRAFAGEVSLILDDVKSPRVRRFAGP